MSPQIALSDRLLDRFLAVRGDDATVRTVTKNAFFPGPAWAPATRHALVLLARRMFCGLSK